MIRLFKIVKVAMIPLVFALIVGCGGSSTSASSAPAGKKGSGGYEEKGLTPKSPIE